MAASRVSSSTRTRRSGVTKRTEFWTVANDRKNPAKGKRVIVKAAVRNSLGQFDGATNYGVGATVQSARIEG